MPRISDTKALQSPDVATIAKTLIATCTDFDAHRTAGLQALANVRAGRNVGLAAKRAALVATKGANAPEVASLDATVASNKLIAAHFSMQSRRTAQAAPKVGADEWVLYGDVHNADATPASQLTIALFAAGVRVTGLYCDTTAADGTYTLHVPMQLLASQSTSSSSSGSSGAQSPVLSLRILDGKGACLADPPDRFTAAAGVADRLVVMLPAPAASSTPPAVSPQTSTPPLPAPPASAKTPPAAATTTTPSAAATTIKATATATPKTEAQRPQAEIPEKAQPAKTAPATTEPAKTETATVEAKTETTKTETEKAETPPKTVPTKIDTAKTETVKTDAVKTEPAKTDAAKAQPADSKKPDETSGKKK